MGLSESRPGVRQGLGTFWSGMKIRLGQSWRRFLLSGKPGRSGGCPGSGRQQVRGRLQGDCVKVAHRGEQRTGRTRHEWWLKICNSCRLKRCKVRGAVGGRMNPPRLGWKSRFVARCGLRRRGRGDLGRGRTKVRETGPEGRSPFGRGRRRWRGCHRFRRRSRPRCRDRRAAFRAWSCDPGESCRHLQIGTAPGAPEGYFFIRCRLHETELTPEGISK